MADDSSSARSRWRRRAPWLLAGLVVVALLVYAALPDPVLVERGTVTSGPLQVTLAAEGRTRVEDRYAVSAPVTGTLQRVTLDPGDAVAAGAVVAVIDPATAPLLDPRARAEARAGRDAAAAQLTDAQAAAAQARGDQGFAARELERLRTLQRAGAVAERDVEEAERALAAREAALTAAEQRVRAARASLRAAETALRPPGALGGTGTEVLVRAPAAGVVLRVLERGPGLVAAGAPLVELGTAGALEVVADVLTQDAVRIAPGAPAVVETGAGGLPARVARVEPAAVTKVSALGVEEQRVDVVLELAPLAAGERGTAAALGDNFRVDARIVLAEREEALRVPTSALFRDGEGWAVFVVREGRAVRRPVQIGVRSADEAEVLGGLERGDVVVLYPGDAVREGARVR